MMSLSLLLISVFSTQTFAGDTVSVTYNGMSYSTAVRIYRDGHSSISTSAGQMDLSIAGDSSSAFCVDLDHSIYAGQTYTAELVEVPNTSPWNEIGWILDNYEANSNATSAAMQVAIWKLIYEGENVYVTPLSVESAAQSILAAADGSAPLSCSVDPDLAFDFAESSDGTITLSISVSQDGAAAVGENLSLSISGGYLDDSEVETDSDGVAVVVIDPDGNDSLTVDVELYGRTVYRVDPTGSVQELIAFTYEECTFNDSGSWSASAFGDPRTIGFWGHNVGVAAGTAKGAYQVSGSTISSWLPLEVFGTSYTSISALDSALNIKKASMAQRAQQQCLATMLNVQYGEIGWFTDMGGLGDLWELWSQAEAAYSSGAYESAKTLCDTINNL